MLVMLFHQVNKPDVIVSFLSVCHCRTCKHFFFFQKYFEIWMNLPVSVHVVTALSTTKVVSSLFKAEATYQFFQVRCNVL